MINYNHNVSRVVKKPGNVEKKAQKTMEENNEKIPHR